MSSPVQTVRAQPVCDTSAYASGDLIGTKLTFDVSKLTPGKDYLVQSVSIVDQNKQNAALDLYLFDRNPTGTTFTDQAAFDCGDADMEKVVGPISITTYASNNDNSNGSANNLALPLSIPTGALYGALVSRGTPTYAAATDIVVLLRLIELN